MAACSPFLEVDSGLRWASVDAYIRRIVADDLQSMHKPTVVFDIDATLLLNDDVRMPKTKCNAVRNTPVCRLFYACLQLGIDVFVVTARLESARSFTEEQLACLQLKGYKHLYMRPSARADVGRAKLHARDKIRAQGYTIVLNVGDQWWDLLACNELCYTHLTQAFAPQSYVLLMPVNEDVHWCLKLPAEFTIKSARA